MRASAAGIVLTVTALALRGAAAQPREPENAATAADAARSAIEAHRVTVSGEQRPDDIPFRARMRTFFRRFHTETERVARELALTPEDRERLTAFAEEALADYARFARRQMETWCSHVEELDSEPRDTVRWVPELEALAQEQQREDEWTQRYAAALESLSSRARDSIRRYVDTRIVPQMSWTTINLVGLAQDAPEAAAALLRGRCKPDRYAPPVITSTSYSTTGGPMADRGSIGSREAGVATDARDIAGPGDDSLVRARVRFERILSADELIALLSGTGLELESLHHRNVGRGQGTIRFSSGDELTEPLPDTDLLTEAACGFRPHAVVVRGVAADFETLREAAGTALMIELEPDP